MRVAVICDRVAIALEIRALPRRQIRDQAADALKISETEARARVGDGERNIELAGRLTRAGTRDDRGMPRPTTFSETNCSGSRSER